MKLNEDKIEIDASVLAGLDVLSAEERESVLQAIDSLDGFSPDQPLDNNIQKFRPERPFYLLHIDPSLRVIFEFHNGQIQIQDIVRKEALEFMSKATN